MADEQCHAEHAEIREILISHIEEEHATLVERSEIEEADRHAHDQIEELTSAVMGPRRTELEGGGRHKDQGLVHKVERNGRRLERIEAKVYNGLDVTVKQTLSGRDKAAVIVAAISGFVGVIVAFIQVFIDHS